MYRLIFLPLLISVFIYCGSSRKVTEEQTTINVNKTQVMVEDSLNLARSFLEYAKNAETFGDSASADYYFQKAVDIASFYQNSPVVKADTSRQKLLEEISLEYSKYIARINGVEADTLGAADVIEILNEYDENIALMDSDSVAVTIPDVIEEQNEITIPLVLNKKVENAIQYFQGRGRRVFTKWLQRTGWYKDLIIPILREEGVPEELFYLAMIESGYNPNARSYARAVGIWQFISATGKAYDLNYSWWYDERRDPEKSTKAAAKHLKDLYQRFGNWYLAIAGYNFSPGKIEKRMRKYNVGEFWDLPRLPRQTRNYVPTFIAAVHIAKNPEDYGFYVEPEKPIVYDTVTVRECVDLNVVANCVGSTFSELKKLNPALLRWCTPPDRDEWILNIPRGTRDEFILNYSKVPDNEKLTYINHKIRSGETLSQISQKYGVSMSEIKRFNGIRGTLIRAGQYLVIPYPQNKAYANQLAKNSANRTTSYRRKTKPLTSVPGKRKIVHVVKKGQALWDISVLYDVKVSEIQHWNGLGSSRTIYPNQEINIWLPQENKVTVSESPVLSDNSQLEKEPESEKTNNTVIHVVKRGDTLWDIAAYYGVSIREIKEWNNRRNNLIKPGDRLKIVTTN